MKSAKPTLLLLGNDRAALAFAREVAPLGFDVMVTKGGGEGRAEYSRFVDRVWYEPDPAADPAGAVAKLAALLRMLPEITAVAPISQPWVLALAAGADSLPDGRVYVMPPADVVEACCDKPAFLARARALGIPVPDTMTVTDHASLALALVEFNGPVVARPLGSELPLLGRKALVLPSRKALNAILPHWPDGHEQLILQRQVPGRRHNLYFAAANGKLVRVLQTVIHRTDAPDGSGLAVKGETVALDPRLIEATGDLVRDYAYHGIGCCQFLVDDASGRFHLLELNPRIAGHHVVPAAAGLELGRIALALARRERVAPDLRGVEPGLRYTWTYGALRGLRTAVFNGAIGPRDAVAALSEILAAAWQSDLHVTWRWHDPLPTILLFLHLFNPFAGARDAVAPRRAPRPRQPRTALINGSR